MKVPIKAARIGVELILQKATNTIGSLLNLRYYFVSHQLGLSRVINTPSAENRFQDRLFVRVDDPRLGLSGYGEDAPHPVFGPKLDTLILELVEWKKNGSPKVKIPNAISMALLDLAARLRNQTLGQFLELPEPQQEYSSLATFSGISSVELLKEIEAVQPIGVKLKLKGGSIELALVSDISNSIEKPLVLDVNGHWSPLDAEKYLDILAPLKRRILWVEQPCRSEEIRKRFKTDLVLYADEAVATGLVKRSVFQGVVIKVAILGLARAIYLAQQYRALGLNVTIGCHLQSSLMTSASLALAGLCSAPFVDLDTFDLVTNDPFDSVAISGRARHLLRPSREIGIGVLPCVDLDWTPLV